MSLCISSIFKTSFTSCFLFTCILCILCSFELFSQTDSLTRHSKKIKIEDVIVTGNKKTRTKIILRELTISIGDSTYISNIEYVKVRSQQNLINTSLFNFVTITDTINTQTNQLKLFVDVKERWYIWPQVIFEIQDRNFNQWWLTKDLFRINYGGALDFNNITGNKDVLSFIVRLGYSERIGVSYKIPYINKAQTVGIGVSFLLNRNNEINYRTKDNKLLFYRDYNHYVREETETKIGITVRKNLNERHSFEAEYNTGSIRDTINELNPSYFSSKNTRIEYISLQYRYTLDLRDNKPYPLKGWYAEFTAVKDGIGLLKKEFVDNTYATIGLKYYKPLSKRFFMANSIKLRTTAYRNPSYYFNKALGYSDDYVRGYEYYVIDGQNFALGKTTIKYRLVKPRVIDLHQLKRLKKFNQIPYAIYLSAFGDGAYVDDSYFNKNNPLNNAFIFGYGAGVDLVTYYDNVIRIEYSFTRQFEHGLFLHFTAGL